MLHTKPHILTLSRGVSMPRQPKVQTTFVTRRNKKGHSVSYISETLDQHVQQSVLYPCKRKHLRTYPKDCSECGAERVRITYHGVEKCRIVLRHITSDKPCSKVRIQVRTKYECIHCGEEVFKTTFYNKGFIYRHAGDRPDRFVSEKDMTNEKCLFLRKLGVKMDGE